MADRFVVLVCGGRDYGQIPSHVRRNTGEEHWHSGQAEAERRTLFDALDKLHAERPITCIIQGGASGADRLAVEWAMRTPGVAHLTFAADWHGKGRAAGPIRNQAMLDDGRPDMVLAAFGGRGTADMVRRAERAGVPVRRAGEGEA